MCRNATVWRLVAASLAAAAVFAQTTPRAVQPDWRRIGNSAVDLNLAAAATGPVARVWYSVDGLRLYALTASGRTFETQDFENWSEIAPVRLAHPAVASMARPPERGARIFPVAGQAARLYALGTQAWRSEDNGDTWANLTGFRGFSLIGSGLADLAVSPRDSEEIVVAGRRGVWRSVDGGSSWSGLNQGLPNLPLRKLSQLPSGARGVRISLEEGEFEWAPGEKAAWRLSDPEVGVRELGLRQWLSALLGANITAHAWVDDMLYAGSSDGRLWASSDRGRSWRPFGSSEGGPVLSIFADAKEPRLAVAALGRGPNNVKAPHVLRTFNGGIFWDDWTSNLPDVPVYAVAVDRGTGAMYAASEAGLFHTIAEPLTPGPATNWISVGGHLPKAPALDVKLDPAGNQLYVALEGYGVYAALAPHRSRSVRVVNAADFSARAAAPGALLTVLGAHVNSVKSGALNVPVLAASEAESQVQVPFEATGSSLALAIDAQSGRHELAVPLEPVSPAIFVDRDGTPMLLDADSGMVLESSTPVRAGSRLQLLATGLGSVRPRWPTGLAAPLENPPEVTATVKAFLDDIPLAVSSATLAPGYIGFYLIEIFLPGVVNDGPAELYIEIDNRQSNRVRMLVEQ